MKKHLCVIIERYTGKELDSFIIDGEDWFYARHKARAMFEKKVRYTPSLKKSVGDWYVDGCEIED